MHFRGKWTIQIHFSFWGQAKSPPRCAPDSNLINSVNMLRLHIRFQIFVLKMCLWSQRGCNLQSAAMKFNIAMHMITVPCILKGFLNRGITRTVLYVFESILVFHKLYIILFLFTPTWDEKRGNVTRKTLYLRPIVVRILKKKLLMVSLEPLRHAWNRTSIVEG